MSLLSNTSIGERSRKALLAGCTISDIIVRVKAYGIAIQMRMYQAEEMAERIQKQWEEYNGNQKEEAVVRNIYGDFQGFIQGTGGEPNLNTFKTIFARIDSIVESIENYNLSSTNTYLNEVLGFLGESYRVIEDNAESDDLLEIDYEHIVQKKVCIQHELKDGELDQSMSGILEQIYLYYTQFWRILEMYGDLFNEVNIFIDIFLSRNAPLIMEAQGDISTQQNTDVYNNIIELKNGLSYNTTEKGFYYDGKSPYLIIGGGSYEQREKFMEVLCNLRRGGTASYDELIDATGKKNKGEIQTIYKNIRDGIEGYFGIGKNVSEFCENITRVGYKLKRR